MMVPRSYPLVIEDSGETRWLVVGWEQSRTGVYEPVVVPASPVGVGWTVRPIDKGRCPWRVVEYGTTGGLNRHQQEGNPCVTS